MTLVPVVTALPLSGLWQGLRALLSPVGGSPLAPSRHSEPGQPFCSKVPAAAYSAVPGYEMMLAPLALQIHPLNFQIQDQRTEVNWPLFCHHSARGPAHPTAALSSDVAKSRTGLSSQGDSNVRKSGWRRRKAVFSAEHEKGVLGYTPGVEMLQIQHRNNAEEGE